MTAIGRHINSLLTALIGVTAIFAVFTGESIASNHSPQAQGSIPAISVETGGTGETIGISSYFSDPDSDALSYLAASADAGVATVSVSGSDVTITPVDLGSTTATIVASDGSMTATQTISVTVVPVGNRAPVAVGTLDAMALKVDSLPVSVNVANNFSDPDGDALSYSAASSDEDNAVVTVLGTVVTITPVSVGEVSVNVTASDAAGLTATQSLAVNVIPTNSAPLAVGVVSDLTLTLGVGVVAVDVRKNFSDPDGQALTFTAASSDASVATVGMSGGVATVTPIGVGTATATIVASDGSLTAIQTLGVTIMAPQNNAPVAVGTIPGLQLASDGATMSVNVAASFSDPDGDALIYEAVSSDTSMATVDVLGTVVTVTPISEGLASVAVTAIDGGGLTATQEIAVEVIRHNSAPIAVGAIDEIRLNKGDSSLGVDVTNAFSDPDNDVLTYTVSSSDDSVARAKVSGSELFITSIGVGTADVSVVASDVHGLSVTQNVSVTVEPAMLSASSVAPLSEIELLPNYPSPFNPDTWIPFRLSEDTNVTVTIFDVSGNTVRTFELGHMSAGSYESKGKAVYWDGKNDFGELVSTGIYFYRLSTPHSSAIRKTSIRK